MEGYDALTLRSFRSAISPASCRFDSSCDRSNTPVLLVIIATSWGLKHHQAVSAACWRLHDSSKVPSPALAIRERKRVAPVARILVRRAEETVDRSLQSPHDRLRRPFHVHDVLALLLPSHSTHDLGGACATSRLLLHLRDDGGSHAVMVEVKAANDPDRSDSIRDDVAPISVIQVPTGRLRDAIIGRTDTSEPNGGDRAPRT
jgi:hypothetical protein